MIVKKVPHAPAVFWENIRKGCFASPLGVATRPPIKQDGSLDISAFFMAGGLKNVLPYLRIDEEKDSLQIQEKRGTIHETGKKKR